MSGNILESIRSFVEDRKVDESELIGMIGEAVNKVASDWLGKSNLETIFIPERNEFKIYELLEVSSEDGENTISLADAKELDSDYELGNLAKRSIQLEGLNRMATKAVRRIIHKLSRANSEDRLKDEHSKQVGSLVYGTIVKIDDAAYFELEEGVSGILPLDKKLQNDKLQVGMSLRMIVESVEVVSQKVVLNLSRKSEAMVSKLLEREVPEIKEGTVKIIKIARNEDGFGSKIIVSSSTASLDPVGACIGLNGSRIQQVVRELSGEKIDIIAATEDPEQLIKKALLPAQVRSINLNKAEKVATIVAEGSQLTKAIGRNGINIKLATAITGWKLSIMSPLEYDTMIKQISSESDLKPGKTNKRVEPT